MQNLDNIFVFNKQKKFVLNTKKIKELARFILDAETVDNNIGINLMFTGNKKIREFNKKYLKRDTPTDVISFDGDFESGSAGDVIISIEKAAEYSSNNNIDLNNELERYIIHGILHCLGYDDTEQNNKQIMFNRQEHLLKIWEKNQKESTVFPRL